MGRWWVVRPQGETIDYDTATAFRTEALAAVERGEWRVAVDLTRVRLIDSMGLGAFVAILKKLGPKGALRVFGATPELQNFFKLMRVNHLLPHFETEWEAVEME